MYIVNPEQLPQRGFISTVDFELASETEDHLLQKLRMLEEAVPHESGIQLQIIKGEEFQLQLEVHAAHFNFKKIKQGGNIVAAYEVLHQQCLQEAQQWKLKRNFKPLSPSQTPWPD